MEIVTFIGISVFMLVVTLIVLKINKSVVLPREEQTPPVDEVPLTKSELAGKRTRKKGKFVADDPATPDSNEAYIDGKKPRKPRKPSMKIAD